MRIHSRLLVPLATAGLLVGVTAAPAQAQTTLDHGHVDVLDIDYAGGALDLGVLAAADTGSPGRYDPAEVTFEVPPAAELTVPSSWNICITDQAWVLPQNPASGLLWAGWNAEDVAAGDVDGDQVMVTLTGVSGPAGFCVFSASGGQVTQVYVDGNGSPDSFTVAAGGHTHANWGFDEPGTYRVTFKVTATDGGTPISSGEHTFTFEVSS